MSKLFASEAFTRYYTAPWRTQAVRQHDLSRSRAGTETHLFSLVTGLISQNLDWNHQHMEFYTPGDIAGFTFRVWRVFSAQQGGQCISKVPYKTEEEHPESLGLTAKWDSNRWRCYVGKCTVRQFSTENSIRGGKNFKVEWSYRISLRLSSYAALPP